MWRCKDNIWICRSQVVPLIGDEQDIATRNPRPSHGRFPVAFPMCLIVTHRDINSARIMLNIYSIQETPTCCVGVRPRMFSVIFATIAALIDIFVQSRPCQRVLDFLSCQAHFIDRIELKFSTLEED